MLAYLQYLVLGTSSHLFVFRCEGSHQARLSLLTACAQWVPRICTWTFGALTSSSQPVRRRWGHRQVGARRGLIAAYGLRQDRILMFGTSWSPHLHRTGLCVVVASQRAMDVMSTRSTPIPNYYASLKRWLPIMKAYEQRAPKYFATPPVQVSLQAEAIASLMLSTLFV